MFHNDNIWKKSQFLFCWNKQFIYIFFLLQVGDVFNLKSISDPLKTIAIGVLDSNDPSKIIGEEELGSYFSSVIVQIPISPDEYLIKTYGQFKKIGQVVGAPIAWPTSFVVS